MSNQRPKREWLEARMTDASIVAAGFYRACDHSYFNLCPACATARVRAIREEAVKETREWEGW